MSRLSCGYEAPTFGAHYPDGVCIEGYMWDMDSGDQNGLTSGGDIPCPHCNTGAYIEYISAHFSGNSKQRRQAQRAMARKIKTWAAERSSFDLDPA
jgi:hypothetical protein